MPEIVADIPVKMPARPTTSFIPISKPDEKVIPAKTKAPKAHHVPWLAISLACLFTFTMSLAAYFAFKS
ncbi:hypothetical protein HYW36_02525 [Candidatus Saccharibacteria bacterium]|nr:hypothetical protein [Candidatus Saccharibacteria bacterium]